MRHGNAIVLMLVALVLGGLGARTQMQAPLAHAAKTWTVQVGADVDAANGVAADAYFPEQVTIDAGDTVSWVFPSVDAHTVTFDNGVSPGLATTGRVRNADGSQDITRLLNPINVSGANQVFDPTLQTSSGAPLDPPDQRTPFALTFNQPGVFTYRCSIHAPAMWGAVTVVPAGSAIAETPDQAAARGKADLNGAVASSTRFFAANTPSDTGSLASPNVHNVTAGEAQGKGIEIFQFVDKNIPVHRGDTVVWTNPQPSEAHTITFLSGGDEPTLLNISPLPTGQLQIVRPADVFSASGGTTYTGQGYLNSGSINEGRNSFAVVIDAPSGTYQYLCLVHGDDYNMKGTITVAP